MRVVDYTKNSRSVACKGLWVLGLVAGLFSLVVCSLMIANSLRLKTSDPIHTPALQRLMRELKSNPGNEALKEQIRELDYLARHAFFSSQRFNQIGIWLLLGGVVVTLVSFKTLGSFHRKLPYPDSRDPKDDIVANALWARQSVTVVCLFLAGLALSLSIPWKSALDHPQAVVADTSVPVAKIPILAAPMPSVTSNPAITFQEERLRHWPGFRGPADGHAAATNLPTQWDGSSGRGILWKTEVPLPGFGSPIVWGDRVFVSGANDRLRVVYAFDAGNGNLLWERSVPTKIAPPASMPEVNAETGYAAPTMATDGIRVFAIFATGDLAAYTLDGAQAWGNHLGVPVNGYGHSSSLVVFEDILIVQFDHKGDGFVSGYDVCTGAIRWRTERKLGASWATPALVETGGHTELILVADAFVAKYGPRTGQELGRLKCLASADAAPTPVFANGWVYVAADSVKLAAIDLKTWQVVWENKDDTPGVGTPVAAGGFLFAGLADGGIVCWDARTGERLWMQETDDGFYSSPIVAGNWVYLLDRKGKTFIFEASGVAFKSIAQPVLGEEAVTTPATYGDSWIYRGARHLFRIGT